jgi:glycosyltransferase involved in cell wall biosynthesis
MSLPRVLVLGHYRLDRLDRAPKVRTWAMTEALARQSLVTLIAGTRGERAPWLRDYLQRGRLSGHFGVYLESATSTMTPADWRFLTAVRRAQIPLAIYIRDWYQRFPDLYPPKDMKERALATAYRLTLGAYARLATTLFFPSPGLLDLFRHPDRRLLPPGGNVLTRPPLPRRAYQVLYVGANGPHDGVDTAVAAMGEVHRAVPESRLILVMRRAEWPEELPAWCEAVEASGHRLQPARAAGQAFRLPVARAPGAGDRGQRGSPSGRDGRCRPARAGRSAGLGPRHSEPVPLP